MVNNKVSLDGRPSDSVARVSSLYKVNGLFTLTGSEFEMFRCGDAAR